MIGVWEKWNDYDRPGTYGDSEAYGIGAEWLSECSLVEDWGCGRGWMRTLIDPARYRGIDGASPHAAVIADLCEYRSEVPGIFMRNVLEHNYRWAEILANALSSFTDRLALSIFTPLVNETREIAFNDDPGVPDISFRLDDLTDPIGRVAIWTSQSITSDTHYGSETVILAEKWQQLA